MIGGQSVCHHLFGPYEAYERFFANQFHLKCVYGLGIVRPPHTVRRIPPRLQVALGQVESWLNHQRPFLGWGRFYVLDLETRWPGS